MRNMNFLMVVPRIVNRVGDWYQFPMGIAYVSSSLQKESFKLFKLNLNNMDGNIHDILKDVIEKNSIDVVLTGGLTGQYGALREIIEDAKRIRKEIKTIIGGGIITSAPEEAMQALEFADYGVIGEGEIICCELCHALESETNVAMIPGIIYRSNSTYVRSKGNVTSVNIEEIPFPDYEGFGFEKLLSSIPNQIGMCEYNTLPIITNRSCPFKCTFCFHPSGQKFRQRSLDSVFYEIDYLVKKFDVKYLSIQDELFGHDLKRVKKFCDRIKPYGIKWLANFRVTEVTSELVALLKESNCAIMAFGVESADNTILRSMKKGITIEQTERALELVYGAGIGIQGVLIFGDVAETIETATRTLNWWKEHIHYELQLSAIITYPGTELYKFACSNGIIKDKVQYIKDGCPLVRLSKMSNEEYTWLFGQLASLPRLTHTVPNRINIIEIDYENAIIDIVGSCISCKTENQWRARLFILETLTCKECGRRYISPIPESIIQRIGNNIERLVNLYGKIAFWGINSYFYTLSEKLKIKYYDHIFYVDKSEVRCGLEVSGYIIQSPEIINEKEIKCVVVSVVQYFAGLKKPIEDEYPKVEKVLSISDLISDNVLIRL